MSRSRSSNYSTIVQYHESINNSIDDNINGKSSTEASSSRGGKNGPSRPSCYRRPRSSRSVTLLETPSSTTSLPNKLSSVKKQQEEEVGTIFEARERDPCSSHDGYATRPDRFVLDE